MSRGSVASMISMLPLSKLLEISTLGSSLRRDHSDECAAFFAHNCRSFSAAALRIGAPTARERETPHIIPSVFHRNGKPISDFRGAWNGACTRAGLPNIVVHDLRRSAVRNLERAGVPRSKAINLTGHKTESVYRAIEEFQSYIGRLDLVDDLQ